MAIEDVEAIFSTKFFLPFLFSNDSDMEFLEVILSSTSSFNNEPSSNIGSIEESTDSHCINDFYGIQFQENDVESDTYLINDDVFDKLLILLSLEFLLYLATRDYVPNFLRAKILLLDVFLRQALNNFTNYFKWILLHSKIFLILLLIMINFIISPFLHKHLFYYNLWSLYIVLV